MRPLWFTLALGFTLAAATAPGHASAYKPQFWAPSLAWSATHVVIATEGAQRDGRLTVINSLAGDLRPGARLHLPALSAFAPSEARRVWPGWGDANKILDGRRLLLFLCRTADGGWRAASENGDWSISLAWLESGGPYGRVQPIRPGPVVIKELLPTEAQLICETLHVTADRTALAAATALTDVSLRIVALRSGALGASDFARIRFLEALLKRCGDDGFAEIERMLSDDACLAIHPLVVTVLERHDAARLRPLLIGLIKSELAFWRDFAPSPLHLKQTAPPCGLAARHYRRTHALLRVLIEHRYPEAMPAVRTLLAYWADDTVTDEWLRYTVGYSIGSVSKQLESR